MDSDLNEIVTLDIEESNDLTFKIKMEGAAAAPAKVRLVCEADDGLSYMFNGYGTGEPEVVQFTLPKMFGKMNEGTYSARVEVLVENRYFAPLQFQINFKKTLSVVAESIIVKPKVSRPEIKVTAEPIIVAKSVATPVAIKFEQKPVHTIAEIKKQEKKSEVAVKAKIPVTTGMISSLKDSYLTRKSLKK